MPPLMPLLFCKGKFKIKESVCKTHDELPLLLNANPVA